MSNGVTGDNLDLDRYCGQFVSATVKDAGLVRGRLLKHDEDLTSLGALNGRLIVIRSRYLLIVECEPPQDPLQTLPRPAEAPAEEATP